MYLSSLIQKIKYNTMKTNTSLTKTLKKNQRQYNEKKFIKYNTNIKKWVNNMQKNTKKNKNQNNRKI